MLFTLYVMQMTSVSNRLINTIDVNTLKLTLESIFLPRLLELTSMADVTRGQRIRYLRSEDGRIVGVSSLYLAS